MTNVIAGLVGVLMATNTTIAASNFVNQTTGISVPVADSHDPVEKEYQKILADDDDAQAQVDEWIRDNHAFRGAGGGVSDPELNDRIRHRFASVNTEYQDFLARHPDHANAHIAYGSFLADTLDEDGAEAQWEKARLLNPKNPAPWNNLANLYGHDGPVKKAFEYYAKAIELNPTESVYYQNLATTVFLFRKDAREYYNIDEQAVFDKALDLYQKAIKYDPDNFPLASDVAQTYYGIRPFRTNDALLAWTNALNIADSEIEKEGVYIHFARINLNAGKFDLARRQLALVTNSTYTDLKDRVLRNITKRENEAKNPPPTTNPPPAAAMK